MRPFAHVLLLVFAASACSTSENLTAPQDTTGTGGGGGGGTVARATLTVTTISAPEDQPIIAALGWPAAISAVDVTIRREDGTLQLTARTDNAGQVVFDDLLPGTFVVSANRSLTAAERMRLPPSEGDLTSFGGGTRTTLAAPGVETQLELVAGRRGSLIISEFFGGQLSLPPLGVYRYSGFVELYNNADSTIYLDGKYLARAWDYNFDSPDESCETNATFRLDSAGVWAYTVYRFPGTGREYALGPGSAVVIATEAVDHGALVTGGLDLRTADFEFIGNADVDNPSVANMVFLGPVETIGGHGLNWGTRAVPLVVDSLDFSALTRGRTSYFNTDVVRFPANKILDVMAITNATPSPNIPYCDDIIAPRFDRAPAPLIEYPGDQRVHRRSLGSSSSGHIVLQRTRTSARDLYGDTPRPGIVP
jgi:hypothetical protein